MPAIAKEMEPVTARAAAGSTRNIGYMTIDWNNLPQPSGEVEIDAQRAVIIGYAVMDEAAVNPSFAATLEAVLKLHAAVKELALFCQ